MTGQTAARTRFQNLPGHILVPLPLPFLQPFLHKIVCNAVRDYPELFRRLGIHRNKTYMIDPVNMPFVLLLSPAPDRPRLRACRRTRATPHDARISGTFLTLLNMIDGRLDGDALFFTRDLVIEGDTEAVVVLRNALDDLDTSIVDRIAAPFGPPARAALSILRRMGA